MSAPSKSDKYPELDGIRGLAILLVLAYHCGRFETVSAVDKAINKGFEFGWAGVDLFFALSGFLITGILLDSRREEGYLRVFFGRRVLRIFPLYFCFLIGLGVFAAWIAPSLAQSQQYLHVQGWYWLYGVNLLIASRGDWNAAPFDSGILWSLAIEEQFYLLWPFIVWKLPRTLLLRLCVLLIVGAFAFRLVLQWHGAAAAAIYTLTPSRIDALLVGALAALLVRGPADRVQLARWARAALLAGSAALLIALAADRNTSGDGRFMQTLGFSALGWIAFGILIMTRTAAVESWFRRGLRSPVLMFFGAYSYALYVLHYVVRNAVFRFFPPLQSLPQLAGSVFPWAILRMLCAAGVALLFALASWHLVERHCLALKRHFRHGPRARPAAHSAADDIAGESLGS